MMTGIGKLLLGRGEKMSIPKAALVWFFEGYMKEDHSALPPRNWDIGNYGAAHVIVEIAGAMQMGPRTNRLVSDSLGRSPFWEKRRAWGMYSGFRGNTANPNIYTPSTSGIEWYRRYYKSKKTHAEQ